MTDQVAEPTGQAKGTAGIDARSIRPGTHLCALYRDEAELARVAEAFVSTGLAAGDRVLYVTSDRPRSAARKSFIAAGIAVELATASGQLVLHSFGDLYGPEHDLGLAEVASGLRVAAGPAAR